MRAKEIKIENSFISIFWQWLGSASLRKNKINSKQTREWAAKPKLNWSKTQTKHFSVVFVTSLCLSLAFLFCVCLRVCVCESVWFWDCAQLLWNGHKMCQVLVDLAWTCYNFHLFTAFYTPFLFFLSLSPLSPFLVVSAFVAVKINEARMCWIVLIGALRQSGHKLRHCNANSIIKATWAATR